MKASIIITVLIMGSLAGKAQNITFAPPTSDTYVPCCKTALLTTSLANNMRKALKTKIAMPGDTIKRVTYFTVAMMPDKARRNNGVENMPVLKPQNIDRMPVIKTDKTGYNMPIAGKQKPTKDKIISVYLDKNGKDSLVVNQ